MNIVKNIKNSEKRKWKIAEKKANKIMRLMGRFSKEAYSGPTCGIHGIYARTPKDKLLLKKISILYMDEHSLGSDINVRMCLYNLCIHDISIDDTCMLFRVA